MRRSALLLAGALVFLVQTVPGVSMMVGFVDVRRAVPGPAPLTFRQTLGLIGTILAAASLAIAGHTVSEGNLFLHVSLDLVHVFAAGVWVGGVVALSLMTLRRHRGLETRPMAPAIVRFSTVATLAIVSVAAAGVGMSFLIVDPSATT